MGVSTRHGVEGTHTFAGLANADRMRGLLKLILAGLENGNIKSQPILRPITPHSTSVGMCSLAELIRETLKDN